ncbi:PD-(D/E)XK nuclease family protein [Prosthecobacter sp.]|uniref:PD-(D/E)XK nuclease family protein n=1 Tax=Prosthecobacter sp. TaxID=1965333 RepID=UPI0037851EC3
MPAFCSTSNDIPALDRVRGLIRHAREAKKHEKAQQQATGERFNLFQILGVGHLEVSTHSALLCDLLSPKGTHGQGAAFLKSFISTLGLGGGFDAESARVHAEWWLGPRTEISGGRLDILMVDKDQRKIAIENKILAAEQENWVRRYRHDLTAEDHLIYLTLEGDSPAQMDASLKDAVRCVGYDSLILKWLEECRKEAATVPIVRESLTQYIHLIQHLTHQNTSSHMNDEIVKCVLESEEDFAAFCALRDADKAVKRRIICALSTRLRQHLPAGFEMISTPEKSDEREGFVFSTSELKAHNLKAVIAFDSGDYRQCYYGFELLDTSKPVSVPSRPWQVLTDCFRKQFAVEPLSSGRWPAWAHWTRRKDWNDEVFALIHFGDQQFHSEMMNIIQSLHEVTQAFVTDMASVLELQPSAAE